MDPKGHAAIVTGAASGLGAETAVHLARAGVKVACLDINIDGARETAEKIGGVAIRCDVTSSDDLSQLTNQCCFECLGHISFVSHPE